MSFKEARILLEIYVLSFDQKVTLSDVQESLALPFPTLSRIIKRYTPSYVQKKKDRRDQRVTHLSIKPSHTAGFEAWIHTRINLYRSIETLLKPKDFERIVLAFQLFEEMMQEIIQKHQAQPEKSDS